LIISPSLPAYRLEIRHKEARKWLARRNEYRVDDDTFFGAEAAHDEGVELLVGNEDRGVQRWDGDACLVAEHLLERRDQRRAMLDAEPDTASR
jgi:hypothetical protein